MLIPTIVTVFGATGDLMTKKIVPALFYLFSKKKLPEKIKIVGFSRRQWTAKDFRDHIKNITLQHGEGPIDEKILDSFLEIFVYQQGFFDQQKDYNNLAKVLVNIDQEWKICSNKFFYLAVPPQYYETIFRFLAKSGLNIPCSPKEGWTRVIVEKPFGHDLPTAQKLDGLLGSLFKEEQIYRIDHYLAKEMLQKILAFRFSDNLFEAGWSNRFIEKIDIRLLESIGVEDRGAFYDDVGALRDVGQNHLLQMLALVTMDRPINFKADAIRSKRAEILKSIVVPTLKDIEQNSFRAQYKGYKKIKGVKPNSTTETYFKLKLFLDNERWRGVPIILESGKRMGAIKKEIVVTFKPPHRNKVVFSLEPDEAIKITFWLGDEEKVFDFFFRKNKKKAQYVEEYEKLLLDCIVGEQTLFISAEEVDAMWRIIDPIIKAWKKDLTPLHSYQPDSSEVSHKAQLEEPKLPEIKKRIGIIGLGKMGGNIVLRLREKGWTVSAYNRTPTELSSVKSIKELVDKLPLPKIIWLMVPSFTEASEGKQGSSPTDQMIEEVIQYLKKGDVVIDGGNSFYENSIERYQKLKKRGIDFLDVGVSGGPGGARSGPALMIGGDQKVFQKIEPLFRELAGENGYQFFEGAGAGHFVKMVHNGIEYGMMQAMAEGFTILKSSDYSLDLKKVADIYNHGSVIESRLIDWLKKAFDLHTDDLKDVTGKVAHTGEGEWTIKTARKMGLKVKIIEEAFKFRILSQKNPSYAGRILSALREQFGGHKA